MAETVDRTITNERLAARPARPAGAADAARLMSAAATPGGLMASGLLASEDITRDAREMLDREEEWEGEGGAGRPVEP